MGMDMGKDAPGDRDRRESYRQRWRWGGEGGQDREGDGHRREGRRAGERTPSLGYRRCLPVSSPWPQVAGVVLLDLKVCCCQPSPWPPRQPPVDEACDLSGCEEPNGLNVANLHVCFWNFSSSGPLGAGFLRSQNGHEHLLPFLIYSDPCTVHGIPRLLNPATTFLLLSSSSLP